MSPLRSLRSFFVFICLLQIAGCGYYWGHGNKSLPKGYKTIFVEVFENRTNEVRAEMFFTNALIDEFRRSGFVQVTDRPRAEVILKGVLLNIGAHGNNLVTGFYDKSGKLIPSAALHGNYVVNVMASLQLVTSVGEKRVWQTTLRGRRNYTAPLLKNFGLRSSNPLYNQSTREQTLALVAKEMMNNAFNQMTENF